MDINKIIENLEYNKDGKFQKDTILEARKNKEEVTNRLLEELEKINNNISFYADSPDYILQLYALYLLAEFREKRAFPVIIKILSNKNQEEVSDLFGDLITEDLKNILASTYNGDLESIYNLIANKNIDEYIRGAAFNSLKILQKENIISQEKVLEIIYKLLDNELKKDNSIVITDIVDYIAENKIYDQIKLVKKLYKENRVETMVRGDYDDFIDEIYGDEVLYDYDEMIDDTIERFSRWACFNKNEDENNDFDFDEFLSKTKKIIKEDTKENTIKKIGRNEPCYCGSGKKYKNCCMNKKEVQVVTPADKYIEKSLKDYPKQNLQKYYEKENIEIDEKLYKVLKHKAIPLWVDRNYNEETRRNIKNMNEALELIKAKCEKENIHTVEDYDNKIAIHYGLMEIVEKYFDILDKADSRLEDSIADKKEQFLSELNNIIDIGYKNKKMKKGKK